MNRIDIKICLLLSVCLAFSFGAFAQKRGCTKAEKIERPASVKDQSVFGEKVLADEAISLNELYAQVEEKTEVGNVVVKGTVKSVCKKRGCWMKIEKADGDPLFVTFKDYGLFMPADIVGKEVAIHGMAHKKVTSAKKLRHYAKEAGKDKEEIKAITEDKEEIRFEADGVLVN